jgi:glycosyltransferase involved in cell wall biosynthesis
MSRITPANAQFVIVAFEGPDEYSRVGGLAVRVRDLARTLADLGFQTHLVFIGDPDLPGDEVQGNLILHRWCQWISGFHRGNVYEGEVEKLRDLAQSFPPYLVEAIVLPGVAEGRVTVLMCEDWQTVDTMVNAHWLLAFQGLSRHVIPVWTANNVFGFHGIDWDMLQRAATLMTISKYMKHQMIRFDVNPLVSTNGIAASALVAVPESDAMALRQAFDSEIALFKIGRFSPDKRWHMALESVAILKDAGVRAQILLRGDRSSYGQEVLGAAYNRGLVIANLIDKFEDVESLAAAIEVHRSADVLNLASFLPDDLVSVIYAAVDGVVANSGHEPFGLVGLEVMGAGGLAFVGSTGEDYAQPHGNSFVLDTGDALELAVQLLHLRDNPGLIRTIKERGRETARAYLWTEVLQDLFMKLEYVALLRGVTISDEGEPAVASA